MKKSASYLVALSTILLANSAQASQEAPKEHLEITIGKCSQAVVQNRAVEILLTSKEDLEMLGKDHISHNCDLFGKMEPRDPRYLRGDSPPEMGGFLFPNLPKDIMATIVQLLDGKSALAFSEVSSGCFHLVKARNRCTYKTWEDVLKSTMYRAFIENNSSNTLLTISINFPVKISQKLLEDLGYEGQNMARVTTIKYLDEDSNVQYDKPVTIEEQEKAEEERERNLAGLNSDDESYDSEGFADYTESIAGWD